MEPQTVIQALTIHLAETTIERDGYQREMARLSAVNAKLGRRLAALGEPENDDKDPAHS